MTTTNATLFPADTQTSLPDMVRAFLVSVRTALAVRNERTRAYAELAQCTDRELADMNISRSDIHAVVSNWQPS